MRSPEDDAEFIKASLVSPSSFESIYDRHFATIHRYLARRIGVQLADDLAAATFVEAFRARARYDVTRGDARPWLYGIAANLIRSHRREERRQLAAYARVASGQMPVDEHVRVDERIDAETAVAHALAGLMPDDRDTLLLFVWGELSYEEVAEALEIPVGTVRSRLHRARRRIRELLGETGQYLMDDGYNEIDRRRASRG